MEIAIIEVPTLKADESGFKRLISIVNQVYPHPYKYFEFDFSHCSRLDQHAVATLGMLAKYIDFHNKRTKSGIARAIIQRASITFRVGTMTDPVREKLISNNFLSHFFTKEGFAGYPKGSYIGYREHGYYLDENEIVGHLRGDWLTDEKLKINSDLKNTIVSHIFEIFMNAYGHGKKNGFSHGAMSCGRYDKKEGKLSLSVVDFGHGVCESVRRFQKEPDLSDSEALIWALKRGNSTKTDSQGLDIPRGLGFGLLSDFVGINQGKIEIYTNSAHAIANARNEYVVSKKGQSLNGTIVDIEINCDGKKYSFFDESKTDLTAYF
ncbi:hypothetical protein [Alcanivorax sp. NBRC 102028]|uniref:hypothetical protein n=1 Tax=Alcanivorax sp. NBRC 102028 TaxID=1113897 RepID=UPI000AE7362D|nr:hypothetical protein [Alcanivorax sp. NBRC 102028]